jgi:hypothetical protein
MEIFAVVETYIDRKRSLGVTFEKAALNLRSFSKRVGDVPLETITPGQILRFLNGTRTSTVTWRVKQPIEALFRVLGGGRDAPRLADARNPPSCPSNVRSLHLYPGRSPDSSPLRTRQSKTHDVQH